MPKNVPKTKYIFVTGGVVSSLGKGLAAASIGCLLEGHGFKVALMNKDLDTFTAIAKELNVPVSFANDAQRYQQAALAAGLGEKDTSVIFTLIEQLAGLGKR